MVFSDLNESPHDMNLQDPVTPSTSEMPVIQGNRRRRSSVAGWTSDEDDVLTNAVGLHRGKHWKKIAKCVPGRLEVQCLNRWQKVLSPDIHKGPWSKEEDELLRILVVDEKSVKWSNIAKQIPGRMGKQCLEIYHNHLKPTINKSAWTKEEEQILIDAHVQYGNKWAKLSTLLPGRTENNIKNHWNCSVKKRLGSFSRIAPASTSSSSFCSQSNTTTTLDFECNIPLQSIKEGANKSCTNCARGEGISNVQLSDSPSPKSFIRSVIMKIRKRAESFKDWPSIISKRPIPYKKKEKSPLQTNREDPTPSSNKEEEEPSTSTSISSYVRRLDFDSH